MSEQTFQKTDNTPIVRRDSAYACLHPVLADAENCTCEVSSTRAPPTQRTSSSPSIPPTQPEEPIADTFENLQTRTLRIADETFRDCVTPRMNFYLDELEEYNFSRDQSSSSILDKMAKLSFGLGEDELRDAQEGKGYTGEPLWDASLLDPGRLPAPKEEQKPSPERKDVSWWQRRTRRFRSEPNLKEPEKQSKAKNTCDS